MARTRLHIGTSGWVYRHWRGDFYPADLPAAGRFAFYRQHFATVEINATFYRLPSEAAVAAWRAQAPPGFVYAVKGSRFITHVKKLADPLPLLRAFLGRVDGLGPRLGPVLFQLPPTWHFASERLDGFLAAFRRLAPRRVVSVEFRHPSWHQAETLAILRRHRAAFCIWHLAGVQSPVEVTARAVYLRLHGSGDRYAGAYGRDGLAPWRDRIRAWLAEGHEVFCYFDNDIGGAAPRDAGMLQAMLA